MNYMLETEHFLRNYKDYEVANTNMANKLMEIDAELEGCKSIQISDMPHGGSGNEPDERMFNLIFERDKTKELLKKNKTKLTRAKSIIKNLDEEQQIMLRMAFLEDISEEEILTRLNISRRTYYRMKNAALKRLGRQLYGISVDGY